MNSVNAIDDFSLELGRVSEVGLVVALFILMLSVALSLSPSDFVLLKRSPRSFFLGALLQMVALPMLTLALCFAVQPSASMALGMILVSCCPGGNMSNILVLLARGNVALSVSLTASSSAMAVFITPLAILFWSGLYPPTASLLTVIAFNPWSFLLQTSLVLLLPLLLGMLINYLYPLCAKQAQKPLVIVSTVAMLVIIVVGVSKYWGFFMVIGFAVLGLVVLHNAFAFLLGYMSARLLNLPKADQRTLTFETGIQNSGLAIVILFTQLGSLGGAVAVAGLWGVWHIVAGLALVVTFVLNDRCVSS